MEKVDFIHSLSKVKVVLGNGFDLHCGLHTTYYDFYLYNFKKYHHIEKLFKSYQEEEKFELDFSDPKIQNINTWDVFFALNNKIDFEGKKWCDIEKLIYSSLVPFDKDTSKLDVIAIALISNINWNNIHSLIFSDRLGLNHLDRFVVKFIKARSKYKNNDLHNFYNFLLEELKEFEISFGKFIYKQVHDTYLENCNGCKTYLNRDYIEDAIYTLGVLCNEENIVAVDSFNYSVIEKTPIQEMYHNINGSYLNPIFGVDTKFLPGEPRYIFTKTLRRIDFDMIDDSVDSKVDFENVIIFGHSLNDADYSYFFPMFDKLDLLNSVANGVLVFAYSVYDERKSEQIESNFRFSISKIIYEYAMSKKLPDPERLLDSLSTQKRIVVYRIDPINRRGKAKGSFELEWEKKINEVLLFKQAIEENS